MRARMGFYNWIVGYPDQARLVFARTFVATLIFTPGLGRTVTAQMTAQEARRLERVEKAIDDSTKTFEQLSAQIKANTAYTVSLNNEQNLKMELLKKELQNEHLTWSMGQLAGLAGLLGTAIWRLAIYLGKNQQSQLEDIFKRLEKKAAALGIGK